MASGNRGVFAVDRGVFTHPMFRREPLCEIAAWIWLLSEAQWEDRRVRIGNAVIQLKRGQLAHSRRHLAREWRWDESRVRRFLERLSKEGAIDPAPTPEATIITICNYDDYQFGRPSSDPQTGPAATHDRPSSDPKTKKEIREEVKNEESPSLRSGDGAQAELLPPAGHLPATTEISPSRKTRKNPADKGSKIPWPDGFDLDGEMHRYATDAGIAFAAVHDLWERFRAHHIKNGSRWAGERGWRAAWQGWVRNEIKFDKERREKNRAVRPSAPARYDPIEHARRQMQRLKQSEEDPTLWTKTTN